MEAVAEASALRRPLPELLRDFAQGLPPEAPPGGAGGTGTQEGQARDLTAAEVQSRVPGGCSEQGSSRPPSGGKGASNGASIRERCGGRRSSDGSAPRQGHPSTDPYGPPGLSRLAWSRSLPCPPFLPCSGPLPPSLVSAASPALPSPLSWPQAPPAPKCASSRAPHRICRPPLASLPAPLPLSPYTM